MLRTASNLELEEGQIEVKWDCKLGEGSYGKVYKGNIKENPQLLAIKIIPVEFDELDVYRSCVNEIKILSMLTHLNTPYFTLFHGYALKSTQFRHEFYITMELLPPETLSTFLIKHKEDVDPLNILCLINIMNDLVEGLNHLYEQKIVHRDFYSQNILFNPINYKLKICDFGSAVILGVDTLEKGGGIAHNVYWMPPESMDAGEIFNETTDIYALGMMAWMLFMQNSQPFLECKNKPELLTEKVKINGERPVFSEKVQPSLRGLIGSMWAQNPKDRSLPPKIKEDLSAISLEIQMSQLVIKKL